MAQRSSEFDPAPQPRSHEGQVAAYGPNSGQGGREISLPRTSEPSSMPSPSCYWTTCSRNGRIVDVWIAPADVTFERSRGTSEIDGRGVNEGSGLRAHVHRSVVGGFPRRPNRPLPRLHDFPGLAHR